MKLTTTIVAVAVVALAASTASAQIGRPRQVATPQHHGHQHGVSHHGGSGHWGGPTTYNRYYHPARGYGGIRQNIQYYPVNPFGYGVPGYGYYGGFPCYGAPYGGTGVYIHREIYLGR